MKPCKSQHTSRCEAVRHGAKAEIVDPSLVYRRDRGVCKLCGKKVSGRRGVLGGWELDHRVPLSRGGAHTYANVQLAHTECNLEKGAKRR